MSRGRLWVVAGIAVVVVAVVLGGIAWFGRDDSDLCEGLLQTRAQQMDAPVDENTVVVLGDSYTQGTGLAGPQVAWPAVLGQRLGRPVVVDGVGATGFTTRGFCPDAEVTYGERTSGWDDDWTHAGTVVVQGSVNDALNGRPDDVEAAASDVLSGLDDVSTVVVVGPAGVPGADAAKIRAIDAGLHRAADDAGRTYVPLLGENLPVLDDGVHPTEAGHQRIADLVAAAIASSRTQP